MSLHLPSLDDVFFQLTRRDIRNLQEVA
jgi:hypothetical protein